MCAVLWNIILSCFCALTSTDIKTWYTFHQMKLCHLWLLFGHHLSWLSSSQLESLCSLETCIYSCKLALKKQIFIDKYVFSLCMFHCFFLGFVAENWVSWKGFTVMPNGTSTGYICCSNLTWKCGLLLSLEAKLPVSNPKYNLTTHYLPEIQWWLEHWTLPNTATSW